MNKEKYTNLLEAIYKNAIAIKGVATLILKESLKSNNQDEKMTLVAFSENFLFSFLDEAGKFYLIIKHYPKEIEQLNLKTMGFYSHNKKLEALSSIIRERQTIRGNTSPFTTDQTINMLRRFKDTTMHIDYKNNKIIKPSSSATLNPNIFNNYIILIKILSDMIDIDLAHFKLTK